MGTEVSKALIEFGTFVEEQGNDEFGVIEDLRLMQSGGDSAIYGLRKPYRLQGLYYLWAKKLITRKQMGKMLGDLYIGDEFPTVNNEPSMLIQLFNTAEKEDIMSPEDYAAYNRLPKQLTIYRGLQDEKSQPKSMSWTLSKDVATWFANRWLHTGRKGKVFEANVAIEDVLMYNNERSEEEIVIDPSCLGDIKEVTMEEENETK